MAAYKDTCEVCGREFTNYDANWHRFCSIGCEAEFLYGEWDEGELTDPLPPDINSENTDP